MRVHTGYVCLSLLIVGLMVAGGFVAASFKPAPAATRPASVQPDGQSASRTDVISARGTPRPTSRPGTVAGASTTAPTPKPPPLPPGWRVQQTTTATNVYDSQGWVATYTPGSRTVTVRGPQRTFAEATNTTATVTHSTWVRMLDAPFAGRPDPTQLAAWLTDRSPDILATAMEYITGAPHDADYGPLLPTGSREEGSDYNDYLGIAVTYPDGVDQPEARQLGAVDCSGYMRLIWGHQAGLSLARLDSSDGTRLPRRAVQMFASAPGVIVVPRPTSHITDMTPLHPGDLVFFDVSTDDGPAVDHVGMYVGLDNQGHHRFVSSRKTANGPTLGDTGGASILDGNGLYAKHFVGVRRL